VRPTRARRGGPAAFSGNVAIVTGGASGIGRALVVALVERAAEVVIADMDGAAAEDLAAALRAGGGRAEAAAVDVREADRMAALIQETCRRHTRLDLLFNVAGIAPGGPLEACTVEDWRRTVAVNLGGVVHGALAAYPAMRAQGSGHIVNMASLGGLVPAPQVALYAASKHGVVGFSTALRSEARAHGVRVSVACPGFVTTDIRAHTAKTLGRRLAPAVDLAAGHRMAPEACAAAILRGVARNQGIIVFPTYARLAWWLYRLAPAVVTDLVNPRLARRLTGG
jgi:NAD(P)-dependent dehydrogenase (short-subunit alcohol dehydrogenase family)